MGLGDAQRGMLIIMVSLTSLFTFFALILGILGPADWESGERHRRTWSLN